MKQHLRWWDEFGALCGEEISNYRMALPVKFPIPTPLDEEDKHCDKCMIVYKREKIIWVLQQET